MSDSRRRTIAVAAGSALLAAVLVLFVVGLLHEDESPPNREAAPPAATRTATPDAQAAARAAITKVALAYQAALAPTSKDNPCKYMTALAADYFHAQKPTVSCADAIRSIANKGAVGLFDLQPRGLGEIEFGSDVEAIGRGPMAGAKAEWAGDPTRVVTFVQEESGWRIAG